MMTGKDANVGSRRFSLSAWKPRLSLIGFVAAVLLVCAVVRWAGGPGAVLAQAPRVASKTPTPAPATNTGAAAKPANGAKPVAGPDMLQKPDPSKLTVMAVINGEQISRQDLGKECLVRYGKEVLETMVNRFVITQACQARGLTITDQDVEQEIDRIAQKFGLARDRWLAMLKQERDISPDQYRREIIWPTLALRKLAERNTQVTEPELRRAFESEYGPAVKVRIIVSSNPRKAEETQRLAAKTPDDFPRLAKERSEDTTSASVGGLIPPIRLHVGDPAIEKMAFSLKEGQVSPVVSAANQFLVMRCEARLPERRIATTELPRVNEQLRDRIRDEKLRTAAGDLFKHLQAEAKVVNVINDKKLMEQNPGVAAMINGRAIQIHEVQEECVKRHGSDVLEGEVNRRLLLQELRKRNKVVQEPDLDVEIARAAESYGYLTPDGKPDIKKWLKTVTETDGATVDLYVRDAVWPTVALKKLVEGKTKISEEDLQKGFESNYGPRAQVLAIVVGNQRHAQQVWEMARNNPTEQFFGELATQYSVEPVSKENNGKVPPIRKWGGQQLLEKEAFRLQPGELSGIIQVGERFAILRGIGLTEPVVAKMDEEIRRELYKDLLEKKMRADMAVEFDRIKEESQIDNFLTGKSQSAKKKTAAAAPAATSATRPVTSAGAVQR